MRYIVGIAAATVCAATVWAAGPDAKLLKEAKLTEPQARKIALTKAPGGMVKSAEIEREHGHLVWSFDIGNSKSRDITEVLVDAKSGQIVSVQSESPSDQAAEARADRAGK